MNNNDISVLLTTSGFDSLTRSQANIWYYSEVVNKLVKLFAKNTSVYENIVLAQRYIHTVDLFSLLYDDCLFMKVLYISNIYHKSTRNNGIINED